MNNRFNVNLNIFINSKDFLLTLKKFNPNYRLKLIGLVIEYLILHKDFYQINKYIDYLFKDQKNKNIVGNHWIVKDKNKYLINSVANRLSTNNKIEITRHINKVFYQEGFFYHSFNGGLLNLIKKNGLNSDKKLKLWEEAKYIQEIFNMSGYYSVLGFIDSYEKNKIFLSANFQSLYKYTLSSPEWFDQFTSRTINHLLNPNVYENSFYTRDYKKAKNNIIDLINNINNRKIIHLNNSWKIKIEKKGINLDKLLNYCLDKNKKIINNKNSLAINYNKIMYDKKSLFSAIDKKKFDNRERLFIYMDIYDKFCRKLNKQEKFYKINLKQKQFILESFDKYWEIFGQKKFSSFLVKRSIINKNKKYNYNNLFIEKEWDITYNKKIKYNNLFLINLPYISFKK